MYETELAAFWIVVCFFDEINNSIEEVRKTESDCEVI